MIAGGWRVMNIDEAAAAESIAAEDPEASAVPGSNKKKTKKGQKCNQGGQSAAKTSCGMATFGNSSFGDHDWRLFVITFLPACGRWLRRVVVVVRGRAFLGGGHTTTNWCLRVTGAVPAWKGLPGISWAT